ncbi:MAG: PLD nuclease N-terminal domain-containing protein [Actinomycetota bacterium]
MFRYLIPLLGVALFIFALVDCIKVPDDSMYQNGNKLIWVIVIVFVPLLGSIAYLLIGKPLPNRYR